MRKIFQNKGPMSKPHDASPSGMKPEPGGPSINTASGDAPPASPSSFDMTRALWLLLICGCLIGLLAFGIRSSFGLFVDPVSKPDLPGSFGFGREAFAFALALQNLAWGIGQPIAGALADRFGFVLVLPALDDLSPEARRSVIRSGAANTACVARGIAAPALRHPAAIHCRVRAQCRGRRRACASCGDQRIECGEGWCRARRLAVVGLASCKVCRLWWGLAAMPSRLRAVLWRAG